MVEPVQMEFADALEVIDFEREPVIAADDAEKNGTELNVAEQPDKATSATKPIMAKIKCKLLAGTTSTYRKNLNLS